MIGNTTQLTYITDPDFDDIDGPCSTANAPNQVCAPRKALPETTLYVPLQFWFCRNPGLAVPLIALQYHEVKINLDLRAIDECLWAVNEMNAVYWTLPSLALEPTTSLWLLLLSTSTTFSLTLMSADAWPRTLTSI